jgi:hypothetical protein
LGGCVGSEVGIVETKTKFITQRRKKQQNKTQQKVGVEEKDNNIPISRSTTESLGSTRGKATFEASVKKYSLLLMV